MNKAIYCMKHNKNVKKKAFFMDSEEIRTLLDEYERKARLLVESRKEEHILYAIKTYNGTNERYDLYCHAVSNEQLAAFTRLDYAGAERVLYYIHRNRSGKSMEAEITVEELLKRENVSEVVLVDGNEETKFEKGMLNKDTLGKSVVKYWYDKEILYVELCL